MAKKKKARRAAKPKRRTARGSIKVTVARLSQDADTIVLPKGGTLRDALVTAGFNSDGLKEMVRDVRVNGKEVALGAHLKNNDFITVNPRVQGG